MLRFEVDEHGRQRSVAEAPFEAVAHWFDSDVNGDLDFCTEVEEAVRQVQSAAVEEWQSFGNVYAITIRRQAARISSLFEPQDASDLTLPELRTALQEYVDHLAGASRKLPAGASR